MTLKEFCKIIGLTMEQATGKAEIDSLDLRSLTTLPEGCQLSAGGSLDLRSLTTLPEGCQLSAGDSLDLRSLTTLPEGCQLSAGDSLDLRSLTTLPEGCQLSAGGYLDLSSLTTLPEGCQLSAGGYLYLWLRRIYRGDKISEEVLRSRYLWRNKEYIKVDGVFTKIISERGNVMRVQRIARKDIEYLVTDGAGKWAHGATLKEAKDSLIYKISNRDKSKYEAWTTATEVTHAEAIEAYRVITGACAMGTRHFCETILGDKKKDKYTVAEVIELTKGQYGAESFEAFFKK